MQYHEKRSLREKLNESPGPGPIFIIEIENSGEIPIKIIPKLKKPEIFDPIIKIYNSIGHAGQDATAKNVNTLTTA